MRIRFWGVRGSIPAPAAENVRYGGNTACIEVAREGGAPIILDAGTGIRRLGMQLEQAAKIHLLFTHFHWDHMQGLPFFAPLYREECELRFYAACPPHVLRKALGCLMRRPHFPVPWQECRARRRCFRAVNEMNIAGVAIRTLGLHHPGGSTGYRIESGGKSVVLMTDHEHGDPKFDQAARKFAAGADVLIYDAQFTPGDYKSHVGWGHSTWLEGVRVARDAKVGRLILFHHDPERTDSAVDQIVDQARKRFPETDAAREGMEIRIG